MTFGYDLQAAHYLDGQNALGVYRDDFYFLAVEKTPPYAVAVYRADDAFLSTGRTKLAKLRALYAECLAADSWPGYPDTIMGLALPTWALAEAAPDITFGGEALF